MIPTFTAEEICHLSQMYYVTNLCHLHNGLLKLVTQLLQPSEGRFKESLTNVNCKSENESEVAQSCPTLCDPKDCSPPSSSVHGILQARILEWVAISFSRGIFPTRGSNPGIPHCRLTLYRLSHQGIRLGD